MMILLGWLVTGCTSGFGVHIVLAWSWRAPCARHPCTAHGDHVISTCRNRISGLQALEDVGALTMELDITGSQATLAKFVADALGVYGGIDVLVNSAGYIESSALDELTYPLVTCYPNSVLILLTRPARS